MSRPSQKKALKKIRREKANRKRRNIERNAAPAIWRLDVFLDGKWLPARRFRNPEQVKVHIEDTERRRRSGESIVAGRVVRVATGEVVAEIVSSEAGPFQGPLAAKKADLAEEPKKGAAAEEQAEGGVRIPELPPQ